MLQSVITNIMAQCKRTKTNNVAFGLPCDLALGSVSHSSLTASSLSPSNTKMCFSPSMMWKPVMMSTSLLFCCVLQITSIKRTKMVSTSFYEWYTLHQFTKLCMLDVTGTLLCSKCVNASFLYQGINKEGYSDLLFYWKKIIQFY